MSTATASEVQKNFGLYHDQALAEPVRVTKYGRETVVILSASEFHALKQGARRSLAAGELTETQAAEIARAEIPAEVQYSLKDLK